MKAQISVRHLSKFYQVHKKDPGFVGSLKAVFARKYETVRAVEDISFDPYFVIGSVAIAAILFTVSSRFWNYAIRFYSSASS